MNRVNPLYIGILLLLILAFVSFKLSEVKSDLKDAKDDYKKTLILAIDLSSLKEVYADKAKLKESLQRILKQPYLRSSNIVQVFKDSGATISSQSIDIDALNLLMGKILNASFNVVSLDIKKLSDTNASLDMEIKW